MKMNIKPGQRVTSILLLTLFGLSFCLNLLPAPASASVPRPTSGTFGTWQDHDTIQTGGGSVVKGDLFYSNVTVGDSVFQPTPNVFVDQNSSATCVSNGTLSPDEIRVDGGSWTNTTNNPGGLTTGQLAVATSATNSTCKISTISLANPNASGYYFVWNGTDAIQTSDGNRQYAKNGKQFIESDSISGGSNGVCEDSITATTGKTTATLVMRSPNAGGLSAVDTSSYPAQQIKHYTAGFSGGCHTFTATVNIAPSKNQSGAGGGTNNNTTPTCDNLPGPSAPLTWLICGIFNTLADVSNAVFTTVIIPLLRQPPIPISDAGPGKAIFEIWSAFRIYADIFLVIALIVVVIVQAISGGGVEAYTAKKALPRLLAAVILINVSIYLAAFAVDAVNVIGAGLMQIVTAPIASSGNLALKPSVTGGALFTGGALIGAGTLIASLSGAGVVSAFAAAVPWILLNAILPLIIGFAIAVVVLALRQAIIILLVLISPILFALWFLPNTEGLARKGGGLFAEALTVYPYAVFIFTGFNITAVILGGTGGILGPLGPVIAIVIEGISCICFIFAFTFAKNTVGAIHGMLKNGGQRIKEGVKGNPNDPNSLRNRNRRKAMEGLTRAQQRVLNAGMAAAQDDSLGGWRKRRRMGAARLTAFFGGNLDSRISDFNKQAAERGEQLSATGDDRLKYAGAGYKMRNPAGQMKYYNSKHEEISALEYSMGKKYYGDSNHSIANSLGYHIQKQGQTDTGMSQFMTAFEQNAVANNWTQAEAMDVFAAATYGHKGQMGSYWYNKPSIQKDTNGRTVGVKYGDLAGAEGAKPLSQFVGEDIYPTRRSFDMSNVRGVDWKTFGAHQARIEGMLNQGQAPSARELRTYAQINESVRDMVQTYQRQGKLEMDNEGQITSVSGVTQEAAGIIKAIYNNSEYSVVPTPEPDASGNPTKQSLEQRTIYKKADMDTAKGNAAAAYASVHGNTQGFTFDSARALAARNVRSYSIDVTGDRDKVINGNFRKENSLVGSSTGAKAR